ncbi:MAG: orotidine 5'-phosphate decarboxylase [Methanosarcinaceae archaeon]|nr:orotidine 5'-phosphate decarboxylase [Methanosarcinaceae archaeon]NKQ38169.1 bifunctional hexulose-6-phosphate synthase/ribonuclease regulator [Methanosarcinales archaeon]
MALDVLEIDRAIQIAKESAQGGIDWIEAGTPLIKSEGMGAIRNLKKAFPNKTIVADMKTIDVGAMEIEMAAKSGADIVILLGASNNSTIIDAIQSAKKYGVKLMADMISIENEVLLNRSKELEELGIDYINLHTGIDEQMIGKSSMGLIEKIAHSLNIPIAVAGGLDIQQATNAIKKGADIVIIGGNITRTDSVLNSTQLFRKELDSILKKHEINATKNNIQKQIFNIFMEVSTPNISDAMHRKGALKGLQSVTKNVKIVGKAITVNTMDGDWAKSVEAIDVAKKGEVIVIKCSGSDVAVWGGLAHRSALNKGIAGIVIDGAMRDIDEIEMLSELPIFAKNIVPNAGEPKGFGEINTEIICGTQTINSGDYIIGDDNGVVVVPKAKAYEIARRAKEIEKTEKRLRNEIQKGNTLSKIMSLEKWEI